MGMTLWPRPNQFRDLIQEVEFVLRQRAWLPIYEEGGIDALMNAGEIPKPPPPPPEPSDRRLISGYIR